MLKVILIILLCSCLIILLEMIREQRTFCINEYIIKSHKIKKEQKIVFLSDMHNHQYGINNEKLLKSIRDTAPDLILIGGDMLVGKEHHDYQIALEFVKKLPEICPVYYANGNHEQRMKEKPEEYDFSYSKYHDILKEAGVCFLENDNICVDSNGNNIRLSGLEIPRRCYTHFKKETLYMEEVTERIGSSNNKKYEILLAHNPSYMKNYVEWGADLVLSGHLHGGIVRIPGLVGAISPSFEIFPKYSGDLYYEEDTAIVVSKGLGTHTINIRLFNPAEVVVIHLKSDNSCM